MDGYAEPFIPDEVGLFFVASIVPREEELLRSLVPDKVASSFVAAINQQEGGRLL